MLENGGEPDYTVGVSDSFKEFEATTLYCARCKQAMAVRKRLLLVVGGKTDSDASDFHATQPSRRRPSDRPR